MDQTQSNTQVVQPEKKPIEPTQNVTEKSAVEPAQVQGEQPVNVPQTEGQLAVEQPQEKAQTPEEVDADLKAQREEMLQQAVGQVKTEANQVEVDQKQAEVVVDPAEVDKKLADAIKKNQSGPSQLEDMFGNPTNKE